MNKQFVTAGRAIFTLEMPPAFTGPRDLPPHYTFQVTRKEATDAWPESYFVALLTGPDNESDYTYLGKLDPTTGVVKLTKASKYRGDSWPFLLAKHVFWALWTGDEGAAKIKGAGFDLHHEGRCGRCGRTLTTPLSVTTGFGPHCRKVLGLDVGGETEDNSELD